MNANTHCGVLIRVAACALTIVFFSFQSSFADEHDAEGGESKKPNAIGVFVGATHAEDEYLESLGIEYGRFVSESVEIGALVERAVREEDSTLILAFVSFRPYKGWFLGGGFGRKDPGSEARNTIRVSVGYDFEISPEWSIEPQLHFDIIEDEEDEEVLGVAIVRRF